MIGYNKFAYQLSTTPEGKFMVRVKDTDETCEVSKEVFLCLRHEEYEERKLDGALWASQKTAEPPLSLSWVSTQNGDTMESAWLASHFDLEEEAAVQSLEEAFLEMLTAKEKDVYISCIKDGLSQIEYAKQHSIGKGAVANRIASIREKARKFFEKF